AQSATAIVLQPGAAVGGIDISVGAGRVVTHHIRGRVISGSTEPQPAPIQIQVVPRSAPQPLAVISTLQADANGLFDVAGVSPGSYLLIANDLGAAAIVKMPIEVGDRDLENLSVVLMPPFNL